ncbi:MAG: epoxyqueuosine reductase QueH [Kiritimatiellae bacterium]|nr:epoxyqueuosine reductase QueH [Kiritimatiellia bacterium]MBR1836136.1 epoxyqueuosine reductase QueH [Kiritimatiellia bacterium]
MKSASLLLHACCGPCSTHCVRAVREGGEEPVLFYSNSNIDTREEFDKRLATLRSFAEAAGVAVVADGYDHAAWLAAVAGLEGEPEGGRRCDACFRFNLRRAADAAARLGFGEFSTTLTVSPHKNSARVFAAGRDAAAAERAAAGDSAPVFRETDFKKRGGFQESVRLSKEYGLYRQSWCGCEFSRRASAAARREKTPEANNAI